MRTTYSKLFKDKQLLYRAVNLRRNGWALTSLSLLFRCDRSSLQAQYDKYGIKPLTFNVYTLESITGKVLKGQDRPKTKWAMIDGEKVCLGRSYADYFAK